MDPTIPEDDGNALDDPWLLPYPPTLIHSTDISRNSIKRILFSRSYRFFMQDIAVV